MSVHDPVLEDLKRSRRPYSIDLSLELERQLDNESLPPTPAFAVRPQSIDQTVLTSLVSQLRETVAEVTKDRDALREKLRVVESDKNGAEEALHRFTAKCTQMEDELEEAKIKMRDDEHAISMLRTKVEESRRGLMRLQTENRRMSQSSMSIDTSRAGLPSFGTPSSSKRASFTPLTGTRMNSHRRISSVSDSGFLLASQGASDNTGSPSPGAQTINLPDFSSSISSLPPVSSKRFFDRNSPPHSLDLRPHDPLAEEIEALRREMKSVKAELEETRHDLSEANEAREASETCAKALREFIGEMKQTDPEPVKLPPMPSTTTGEETNTKRAASGWGAFRMWKMEPAVKSATSEVPVGSRKMWKVDTSITPTHKSTESVSSSPSSTRATPTTVAPFATKVGGFFTSRASISSVTSTLPPSQSLLREPSYNGSDTSSIEDPAVEPISPASELHLANVMVRGSNASSSSDLGLPEHAKMSPEPITIVESIHSS